MRRRPNRTALIFATLLSVQGGEALSQTREPRHVSVFGSMGCLEIMSLGANYQLSDQYAVGVIVTGTALGGHSRFFPNSTKGIGIRTSYYFSRDGSTTVLWSNVIAVDCQYLFLNRGDNVTFQNPGGIGLEAIVGRDGFIGPGVGILWGVGIAAAFHSEFPPLVFPAIRLGLHIDL